MRSGECQLQTWLAVFAAASLAVYLVTPNLVATEFGSLNMLLLQYHPVRFGMCVFVLATLVLSTVFRGLFDPAATSNFVRWIRWGLIFLVAIQVMWQLLAVFNFRSLPKALDVYFWWPAPKERMLGAFLISTAIAVFYVAFFRYVFRGTTRLVTTLTLMAFFAMVGFGSVVLSDRWHAKFRDHYGYLLRTNCIVKWEQFKSPDDRLCVVDYRYYPFLGSRRENSVCRPLWFSSGEEFHDYLERNSTSLVVLPVSPAVTHSRYKDTRRWFEDQVLDYNYLHVDRKFVLVRMPPDQ